jgi:hypothetical protein
MCPRYVASRKFSAASEVFSMGMVLLELLTGRVQARDGELYGRIIIDEEPPLSEALDPRIEWPEEVGAAMVELCLACLQHSTRKRPSMIEVYTRLGELERGLAEEAHVEGEGEGGGGVRRVCDHAGCEVDEGCGVECGGCGGFLCDHCFSRHVEGQCRECERGEFVRAGGAVCPLCPGEGGERTMLEAWSVARHVPQHVLQSYLEARDHVTGLRAQREAEEAVGEELEALRGASKGVVGTHCGAISKLLELVCPYPGCSEKWVQSKDGRAAAVCVDCGKDYCGLCFKVCKDMRAANVHVQRECVHGKGREGAGGSMYPPARCYDAGHRATRRARVLAYLSGVESEEVRASVLEGVKEELRRVGLGELV